MATSMKIDKELYLAKCREALARLENPEKAYQQALDKYNSEMQKWGESLIAKKQIEYTGERGYRGPEFKPQAGSPKPPTEPDRSSFYRAAGVETNHYYGYNNHRENLEKLREVITLIEMTTTDTIGVSVANKVSHLL